MAEEIKKEAEILSNEDFEIEEDNSSKGKKRRSDFYIELILFLMLGVLIGLAVKREAVKTITMGFEDYKMEIMKQDYPINQIQKDLMQKNADLSTQQEEDAATGGEESSLPSTENDQAGTGQENPSTDQNSENNLNQ